MLCTSLSGCIPNDDQTPDDSGTPDAGGGDDPGAEGQAWLDAHNPVRAQASPAPVPALAPLTWSASAASVAKSWAENCNYAHNPNRGTRGENIAAFTAAGQTPLIVVNLWAKEKSDYDYASNSCASGKQCGHYTQIVWRGTTQVGCASAKCTQNSPFQGFSTWYFFVCDYAPPGNYVGERPY
nr:MULTISPECIES: CAP domain-containing protein [Myxococcaceae]